jgi:hypothetical protein
MVPQIPKKNCHCLNFIKPLRGKIVYYGLSKNNKTSLSKNFSHEPLLVRVFHSPDISKASYKWDVRSLHLFFDSSTLNRGEHNLTILLEVLISGVLQGLVCKIPMFSSSRGLSFVTLVIISPFLGHTKDLSFLIVSNISFHTFSKF